MIFEKQLSIFDLVKDETIKNRIEVELKELSNQYLIDSHYKKITFGRTLTFHEIEKSLKRFKRFQEYIDKVYEILEKYYDVIEEFKVSTDFQTIGIAKRENCIRIYQPKKQYSIWCISMIDDDFYNYSKIKLKEG